MSIQERNRYKKEIDIFIKRLGILQEQEKSYKNLSEDIDKKQDKIRDLLVIEEGINQQIEAKHSLIADYVVKNKELKAKGEIIKKEYTKLKNKSDKEREDYLLQKEIYDNFLDKKQETINKLLGKIDEYDGKYNKAKKKYEDIVNKVKKDKPEIFDKVLKNKQILQEQEKEIEEYKKIKELLETQTEELDKEYQKLLEDYITKE